MVLLSVLDSHTGGLSLGQTGSSPSLHKWNRQAVSCRTPDEIFLVTNSPVTEHVSMLQNQKVIQ